MIDLDRYRTVDLKALLERPQEFDPDAVEYATSVPISAELARVVRFIAATELATPQYVTDVRAWRTGMGPTIVDDFVGIWEPEELRHGLGEERFLAHVPIEGDVAVSDDTLIPDDNGLLEERLRLEIKRNAIRILMKTAHLTPFSNRLGQIIEGIHMLIGGVNELTGGGAYSALKDVARHPVLDTMIPPIKTDERKHASFYFGYGLQVLGDDKLAKSVISLVLPRTFKPLGTGLGYGTETQFGHVLDQLEGSKRIGTLADDIDDAVGSLLGKSSLGFVSASVARAQEAYRRVAAFPPLATE